MINFFSKGKNQTRVSDKVEEFGSKGVKINPNSLSKDEKLIPKGLKLNQTRHGKVKN